jgi:16S rRNA (uracil1498-N3)-methyltransferase
VPLREAVERAAGERIALVEPSAASGNAAFRRTAAPPADATLFVGPEGGWSADEIRVFEAAGAALVTLPGPTWRADAIGLIALVLADVAWRGRAGWGL